MMQISDLLGTERIEKNIINLFDYIGGFPEAEVNCERNFGWVKCNNSIWPNFVFGNLTDEKDSSHVAKKINKLIVDHEAPELLLFKNLDINKVLFLDLDDLGIKVSAKWTGMSLTKSNIKKPPLPNGFSIRKVNSMPQLEEWIKIANVVLFNQNNLDINLFGHFIEDQKIQLYTGFLDNIPIGTGMIYYDGQTYGIYMISTKPEFRNRGLGGAITYTLIENAVSSEDAEIILHATKMGEKVYLKLGFVPSSKFYVFWKIGNE